MCYHFQDHDTEDYIKSFMSRNPQYKSYVWQGAKYYVNGFAHGKNYVAKQGAEAIETLEWGLIPFWVKTKEDAKLRQNQTLNAKSETVFELPSFRHSIKKQKCLIFAKGFFEWRQIDAKNKIPYIIGVRNSEDMFTPFTFGGIFDKWIDKETGEVRETFSIITTRANEMMSQIHNTKMRMPLIIPEANQTEWLTTTDEKRIKELMVPYPTDRMMAYPVSKLVSQQKLEKDIPEITQGEEYNEVVFDEFL